jgi:hypothetical protein
MRIAHNRAGLRVSLVAARCRPLRCRASVVRPGADPYRVAVSATCLPVPVRLRAPLRSRRLGNSFMCASAIFPVMIGSSWVTSVRGSWLPCSNSTSLPIRNYSRSKRFQSTPIASPTRASSGWLDGSQSSLLLVAWASVPQLQKAANGGFQVESMKPHRNLDRRSLLRPVFRAVSA